jgi:hypothetical protein
LKLEFTQTAVEIHLSRLIGMASNPDIHKIQIIGLVGCEDSTNSEHLEIKTTN